MPPILEELLSEYRSLDRAHNPQRVREILGQAAPLMDAKAEPKKWAAMRSMYAKLSSNVDVDAAISAYEDALTVWDPVADRDSWATCHSELGLLLAARTVPGSVEAERVIQHLELAVNYYPYLAYPLALFYRYRSGGDPTGNWQQRVKYLNLAISQVSQDQNPADWAALANELGIAYTEESAGDYNQALEERLKLHEAALATLGDTHDTAWADTCLNLADCCLFRVGGDQSANRKQAEDYSRQALTVSVNLNHLDLKRRALLSLGRALANLTGPDSVESLREALTMFDQARRLIDPVSKPELVANVYALEASAYLALLRIGAQQWLEPLVSSCEAALRGFDPQIHATQRRSVLQTTGEGLVESGQFERAVGFLKQALREGEAALARSETTSSRMESIFQLGDSSALLSYCYLKARRYEDALNALDAGKARLWNTDVRPDVPQALLSLSFRRAVLRCFPFLLPPREQ
jgi:tetratricopeptide (TPR) repeat protein